MALLLSSLTTVISLLHIQGNVPWCTYTVQYALLFVFELHTAAGRYEMMSCVWESILPQGVKREQCRFRHEFVSLQHPGLFLARPPLLLLPRPGHFLELLFPPGVMTNVGKQHWRHVLWCCYVDTKAINVMLHACRWYGLRWKMMSHTCLTTARNMCFTNRNYLNTVFRVGNLFTIMGHMYYGLSLVSCEK